MLIRKSVRFISGVAAACTCLVYLWLKSVDPSHPGILTKLHEIHQPSAAIPARPAPKRGKVILMSYMRSGSTFTGDIFQFSPDVFYVYEPLLYTNDLDLSDKSTLIRSRLTGSFRNAPDPPDIVDFTLHMLRCNFTEHNLRFLLGIEFSKSMTAFQRCKQRLTPGMSLHADCGKPLQERCEQRSTAVAKILRLKMWEIDMILSRDPEVKVIHLVRDPRGIAQSRERVHYYFKAISFCQRFNLDANLSATVQSKFPGRLLTVRYEDLAKHPVEISKILYSFAGIPWSDNVTEQLVSITSPSEKEGPIAEHVFSTKRKNSSLTAFSWRSNSVLTLSSILAIQNLCKEAMNLYGYISFKTVDEMNNVQVSSITQDYSRAFNKAQVL